MTTAFVAADVTIGQNASGVALSLIGLIVAGLFLRTVQSLYTTDPSFETRRLAILNVSPRDAAYPLEQAQQYYRDVRARLAGAPGV